jgi:hypothetical protein
MGLRFLYVARWGWVVEIGCRFSCSHAPSKNPPPVSKTQAYIAYLHSRRIFGIRHSLPTPNQQQEILHLGDVPERTSLVECTHTMWAEAWNRVP